MKHAAIFDMDGLLIDSEPMWRKAEIACFKSVGIDLTEDDCRKTMGYRLNEVVDYWFARQPWKGCSKAHLESNILNRVTDLIIAEGKPMPGVYHALDLFEDLDFKIALASSSARPLIEAVLQSLQLEKRFEVVRSAQQEKFGKPHPQVFISTARELGILPENCVVLEDSFHGLIAGKAAKMKVIAVPEPGAPVENRFGAADQIIRSLEELEKQNVLGLFE